MPSLSNGKSSAPQSKRSRRSESSNTSKQTTLDPQASSNHAHLKHELEFAERQYQHHSLFTKESELQMAGHEKRTAEFEALLQTLESQLAAARSSYKQDFQALIKEQDEAHTKKLGWREMRFSAAEKARQDIFLDFQSCRQKQFMELKDGWGKGFAEGRKFRQKLLDAAEQEISVIAASLEKEFEERFKEEEDERMTAVLCCALDLGYPELMPTLSNDQSDQSDCESQISDDTQPVGSRRFVSTSVSPAESNEIDAGSSDQEALPRSATPPSHQPSPVGSRRRRRARRTDTQSTEKSLLLDDIKTDGKDIAPAEPMPLTPIPSAESSGTKSHQERFEDAQAKHQELFKEAESARFGAISNFDRLFTECLRDYRSRFNSMHNSYSRIWYSADDERDAEESDRNETALLAERRREGVFKEVLETMQDELTLAIQKEELWDLKQQKFVTKKARLITKRNEIEDRFKESMRHWEESLGNYLGRDFRLALAGTVTPVDQVICHGSAFASVAILNRANGGKKQKKQKDKRSNIGSTSRSARASSPTPTAPLPTVHALSATFSFRTLLSNTGPLVRKRRPVPDSPMPEQDPTDVNTTKSQNDFESAQQQRDLVFKVSMQERRTRYERNEAKRQREFERGQVQRNTDFHRMRLDQDTDFQKFLECVQARFDEEETARDDACNKAEFDRGDAFWKAQKLRAAAWNTARENLVAAASAAEQERFEKMESWLTQGEKMFETEKTIFDQEASARRKRFRDLMNKAYKSPIMRYW